MKAIETIENGLIIFAAGMVLGSLAAVSLWCPSHPFFQQFPVMRPISLGFSAVCLVVLLGLLTWLPLMKRRIRRGCGER